MHREESVSQQSIDRQAVTRHRATLVGGCCLLTLAAAFAGIIRAYIAHPPVAGLDLAWLRLVTRTRNGALTELFKVLSLIGGPVGGTIIVAAGCAMLLIVGRWRTALYVALAEASGSLSSQLVKHFVLRHRPPHPLVSADVGSFPSGHVITTLAVGLALAFAFARPGHRRNALAAVAAATLVMMFGRTYLAAHWLSDTFESVLIAGGLGLVLWWIFEPALACDRGRPIRCGTALSHLLPGVAKRLEGCR
jgi:membrane-associated phospholipid phosphatase